MYWGSSPPKAGTSSSSCSCLQSKLSVTQCWTTSEALWGWAEGSTDRGFWTLDGWSFILSLMMNQDGRIWLESLILPPLTFSQEVVPLYFLGKVAAPHQDAGHAARSPPSPCLALVAALQAALRRGDRLENSSLFLFTCLVVKGGAGSPLLLSWMSAGHRRKMVKVHTRSQSKFKTRSVSTA